MKKRILFVEDNSILRKMYELMLDDERDRWEVITTGDGREALQLLSQSPFDVVVSDIVVPGLNGAEFIHEIRTRHPRAARIILSGVSNQERVARSLSTTHQFLAKPFEVKSFKATLARICGLDGYLKNDRLKALVGQLGTLPSFPSLYVEIMEELNSPAASIETVATIIARDPAMTAKMLQIVNSAALGLARQVNSAFEAVEFLGFNTVQSLVLSAHIFACFRRSELPGFSLNRLWVHAISCGMIARMILRLEQADPADVDDAYTAGMLHDLGKLMLANGLPEQFQGALVLASQHHLTLHDAELEIFGASHAGVAAYLLGLWGLPAAIVEAVAFHHTPTRSDLRTLGPLAAVHAANVLEQELKADPAAPRAQLDMDYLTAIGARDRVGLWREETAKLLGSFKAAEA